MTRDICDLSVEVRCLGDIAFSCSCLFGERGKNERAPVSNEVMENVFLGIYLYAERIADDLDIKEDEKCGTS